jgi:hypothetical protein
MAPNSFGDVPSGHTFVVDPVQSGSRWRLLQRQPEQVSGVENMHRGPAVGPVADVAGDAFVPGDADQYR